jgi:hypothetical protein
VRRQADNTTLPENATASLLEAPHQAFESLPQPPPLPIFGIHREFMAEQANEEPQPYRDSAVSASLNGTGTDLKRRQSEAMFGSLPDLVPRQSGARQCDRATPCPDGSCCNRAGGCGYGEENCGPDNCISNCNATALCGKDSRDGAVSCPLNVCCSYWGYCGVSTRIHLSILFIRLIVKPIRRWSKSSVAAPTLRPPVKQALDPATAFLLLRVGVAARMHEQLDITRPQTSASVSAIASAQIKSTLRG